MLKYILWARCRKADDLIKKLENEDVGNINLMLIKANMYQNMEEVEKAKRSFGWSNKRGA